MKKIKANIDAKASDTDIDAHAPSRPKKRGRKIILGIKKKTCRLKLIAIDFFACPIL